MFTPTQDFYAKSWAAYATARATTPFVQVKLYSNNFTPIEKSIIADFTEADFTGYAAQTGTAFLAAILNGDGSVSSVMSSTVQFLQTDVTISQLVYGYFVLDNAGNLVGGERFNAPINFNAIGVGVTLALAFSYGPAGLGMQNTPLAF